MALTFLVRSLEMIEILDSRGRPTFEVSVTLDSGATAHASVPSGASTGSGEACERRELNSSRYGGAGVAGVWESVKDEIVGLLSVTDWKTIEELDHVLCALDGTPDKSRLGANVIVGISMACARAYALSVGDSLWDSLVSVATPRLPVPHFNVINGGVHAQTGLSFQEFMIAPVGAPSLPEAIRSGAEIYQTLRVILHERGFPTGLGDEGGFAPPLESPEEALGILVEAITRAGYTPGPAGVVLALDPAASEFRDAEGNYLVGDDRYSSTELIDVYESLIDQFPIWSIEDGLAEDDDDGWKELTRRLGSRIQLVGDDNFVTSADRIEAAALAGIANAALIKPNQVGTVSETLAAVEAARKNDFGQMVSHRSGETTDSFVADLAVAIGCGQVKFGAPARGERVAKYNRLLAISAAHRGLEFGLPKIQQKMVEARF